MPNTIPPLVTKTQTKFDLWLLAPLLAAFSLHLFRLDSAPLWFDETLTASWIAASWNEMLGVVLTDNHLPLYFVLLKAWTSVAGDSVYALRFFNVPFSCATVLVIAFIATTLSGRTAGRWAAWLAAISPYLLHHAQEARMYSLLGFLAAVNVWLVARFVCGKAKKLEIGFLMVNTAMLATHYYAIFLIAVEGLMLLFLERKRLRAWLPALMASGVLFIMLVLAARYLATPHAGGDYEGMKLIGVPGMAWGMLTGYTLMPSSSEFHDQGLGAILPYLPVAAAALVALLAICWAALQSLPKPAWILLLGALAGTLVPPLAMSFLFDIGINPRYAMTSVACFIVLLAAGLSHLVHKPLGWVCAVGLLGLLSFASFLHLRDPGHGREDTVSASKWLDQNVPIDEFILITSSEFSVLTNFYWSNRRFASYPVSTVVVSKANVDAIADAFPFSGKPRAIFMVAREWISDPQDLLIPALQKRYGDCGGTTLIGIRILCLLPPPSTGN
jgi:mannosyltransferase